MAAHKIPVAEIGFDFDGVIADTVEAFIRIACEQYAHCDIRLEDITHFSVEQCLAMDAGIAESIFLQILRDSVGTGLQPMAGAVSVLSELTGQAEVTIITARPEADPVHQWLQTVFPAPVYRRIRVIAMGDHDDKARHIRMSGLSTFVDDRAETCLQLNQAGIHSIVYSQPWNRNRHTLPAVHSWEEIRALCF
jgi:5'(3')-deoxyribonucleotidase